jgi:hypothetical protein
LVLGPETPAKIPFSTQFALRPNPVVAKASLQALRLASGVVIGLVLAPQKSPAHDLRPDVGSHKPYLINERRIGFRQLPGAV